MRAAVYGVLPSHPSHTARLMVQHKGIDHRVVWLLPGLHPALLRLHGFRGGTVPALKLDGRRVQHSRAISRALEDARPEPRLFPADPARRLAVEEAERWGEEEMQDAPRRIYRWIAFRAQLAVEVGVPLPKLAAAANAPVAVYMAARRTRTTRASGRPCWRCRASWTGSRSCSPRGRSAVRS